MRLGCGKLHTLQGSTNNPSQLTPGLETFRTLVQIDRISRQQHPVFLGISYRRVLGS